MRCLILALSLAFTSFAFADHDHDQHVLLNVEDLQWQAAPSGLPPGAEMAILYGNPSEAGPFALRLKFPAGYKVAPHTHPGLEFVTILSGKILNGMGETVDRSSMRLLKKGAFMVLPAEQAHYVTVVRNSIIQITATGPWGITYVDPANDPRNVAKP